MSPLTIGALIVVAVLVLLVWSLCRIAADADRRAAEFEDDFWRELEQQLEELGE